ncbi:MAG TPA: 50S ribosomal protein L29 [Armatimonadota bacterium]|nr:50S ribosomal protein L29 [Armatimonadota bacterium]
MAVRRAHEFHNMGLADLREQLREQKQALYQLRYRLASHQLADVTAVRKARKEIARIYTAISEKERAAATAAAVQSEGGES